MRNEKAVFAIAVGGALAVLSLGGCHNAASSSGGGGSSTDGATTLADAGHAQHGPVNELPIPKETVDSTVNPTHLPTYTGATGVVEGTVWVTGDAAPPLMGKNFDKCPAAAAVYGKTFREGAGEPPGKRNLADAIVGVTGFKDFVPEKKPSKQITIANCAYSARTIDMTFGQALEVKNDNAGPMFAPQFENQLDPAIMIATPQGDPVRLYPRSPGRYRLIDRVGSSWLEADVYVLLQPLHAVTDVAGHFRIEGVPVGKLKVGVTHPAIEGQVQQDVEVKDGVVSTVELTLPNVKPAARPATRNLKPVIP